MNHHSTNYPPTLLRAAAFTLVEIVIVVGVLLLISGVLIIYTQKGGKQIALYRDHATLNQELLRARGFSSGKVRPEGELVCGYGIAFDTTSGKRYTVFKDLPPNRGLCPGNYAFDLGTEEIDSFATDKKVSISRPGGVSTVFFEPGLSAVYIDGAKMLPGDEEKIELRLDDTAQKMTIVINHLGQMYTE